MADKIIQIKDGNDNVYPDFVFNNYTPIFTHFTATDVNAQYYRIGRFVYVSLAVWGSGDGTDNPVTISLPFNVLSVRNYGVVGFFTNSANFPNLHTVCAGGNNILNLEYGTIDNVSSIKGNQIDGAFQCSIQYVCD